MCGQWGKDRALGGRTEERNKKERESVYSERCPKRKLPKPNAAAFPPASSTTGLHTSSSPSASSPPAPSDSLSLDLPGSDSSGVSLQFLDLSADCDWSWSSTGVDETVVNNCLDLPHGHGDLSCQLELPMPDLPSPFEFSAEKSPAVGVWQHCRSCQCTTRTLRWLVDSVPGIGSHPSSGGDRKSVV